jgi:predicted HTH domain antitoxin
MLLKYRPPANQIDSIRVAASFFISGAWVTLHGSCIGARVIGTNARSIALAEVRFDVPDEAVQVLEPTVAEFVRALRFAAASMWYRQGDVTMSTAAAIAGLDLRDFLTALAEHGHDMFTMDIDDVQHDLDVLAQQRAREAAEF